MSKEAKDVQKEEEGLWVARIARDLGANATSIHNWLKKQREALGEPEFEELQRLRKEVRLPDIAG